MGIVAINTVEIHPANGSAAALRVRVQGLLATLNRISGCTAYSLTCGSNPGDPWVVTGYWDSTERMTAHFNLPCLTEVFELTAERLVVGLRFATFSLSPPVEIFN
ncbi:antibiotic biosynthesis monooxygenase family protein [Pseudomonas sp. GZD-222]|uniref:antibiotic biosynthesis monooxygenase family protein n=1 Tax=Pseudomonas sp. GZD-222 TaxID=3404805 RepID=UPI003BB5A9B3